MRTSISFVLAVSLLMTTSARSGTATPPASENLLPLYELVLTHHLKRAHFPKKFSVALSIDTKTRTVVALSKEMETRILENSLVNTALFVPPSELRVPGPMERDPRQQGARTVYRGIEETSSGERVFVLIITGVRSLKDGQLEVSYSFSCGPWGSSGGTYRVRYTGAEPEIKVGEQWVS